MQLHTYLRKSLFGKAALATAALGGLFLFSGAPNAQAADRDDHDRRVARSEYRWNDAYADRDDYHRGFYDSRENHWRNERRGAYQRFDRDDRDHDRDRFRGRDSRRFDRDRDW